MRHLAKYDYPVPAVREIDGPDIVIQRLDGPTLGDAAIAGDLTATEVGEIHADLHRRLQAIPAPSGAPGQVVIHGDLHPLNVIATARGPVVIDWRNAREGTPEYDIAMSAIIFAQVALDPAFEALSPLLREALATYLANSIDPTPGLPAALAGPRQQPDAHARGTSAAARAGRAHPLTPLAPRLVGWDTRLRAETGNSLSPPTRRRPNSRQLAAGARRSGTVTASARG